MAAGCALEMRRMLGNQPGLVSNLRRQALAYLLRGHYKQVLILLAKSLRMYLLLGMLSRRRILALLHDFTVGYAKALNFAVKRYGKRESNNLLQSNHRSVMEKFSQSLFSTKRNPH